MLLGLYPPPYGYAVFPEHQDAGLGRFTNPYKREVTAVAWAAFNTAWWQSGFSTPIRSLMVKVSAGDDPSFEILLERHRTSVVNHLYRLVRNWAIAEELAQDVFLRVYRFRSRYQPGAKFATWLFRITTNVALNWRRDTRRETGHLRSGRSPSIFAQDGAFGPRAARRSAVDGGVSVSRFRCAIESLPPKQLAAVLMHKYEGMDYIESPKCWIVLFPRSSPSCFAPTKLCGAGWRIFLPNV